MVGMAMTFGSADYVTPHGGEPFHYWKRGYGFGHARGAGKHLKSPSVPALLRFTPKGDRAYASSAFWRRKHELGQASSFGIGDRPELARGGPGDSNAGPDNYGDVSFALHFVRRNATRSGISLKPRFPSMEERYRDLSWPEAGPGPAKYNTCIEAGKSSWINGTPMPAWTCQVVLEARNLDCTLQGQYMVELAMTTLFLSPRLIPEARLMWLNWAYIFIAYFGITLAHRAYVRHWDPDEVLYSIEDVTLTVALLCIVAQFASGRKWYLEKSQRAKFAYDLKQRDTSERIFKILQYMVPTHVIVPLLQKPGQVIAEPVERASILFVMIVGFDQHAHRLGPEELLAFLNRQFTQMDHICAAHDVTKIETVGEEYVCAVGVVPPDQRENSLDGHSKILGRLVKVAIAILKLQSAEVQFKMGMHTGPVVAGVIGHKLPRFRLFGDTVNTSARLMQKGVPGQLQFGQETLCELPPWVQVTCRGEIELKGKGQVTAYLLDTKHTGRHHAASADDRPLPLPAPPPAQEEEMCARRSLLDQAMDPRGHLFWEKEEDSGSEDNEYDDLDIPEATDQHPSNSKVDEKFEEVLHELRAHAEGSRWDSTWWRSFGLRTADFTPSLEQLWYKWFHETVFCKKLTQRLDLQATMLVVLTAFEMACCVTLGSVFNAEHWHGHDGLGAARMPLFLTCRLVAVALMLVWRQAAARQRWLVQRPRKAQMLMVLTICAVAGMFFLSYDTVEVVDTNVNITANNMSRQELYGFLKIPEHHRLVPFGSERYCPLLFFAFSLVLTTSHQFLFRSSLVFALLTAGFLTAMCYTNSMEFNLYYSHKGMVLLVLTTLTNASVQWQAEKNSRQRYLAQCSVDLTRERIQEILRTLMPPLVVEEIRELPLSAPPPTHRYHSAVIAQSDLVGFTKLASTRQPAEVVQFIGELFGRFDELTDRYGVYKVETVGDAYIAGQADFPLTEKCGPQSVVLFGLEMVRATQGWAWSRGWSVNCRVGIAYGECIGGIVGTDMQRYHLFGELMTHLEILESTAPEGRVQVSRACKEAVEQQVDAERTPQELFSFEPRAGRHLTTSKGDVHEFSEAGGPTFVVMSSAALCGWGGT